MKLVRASLAAWFLTTMAALVVVDPEQLCLPPAASSNVVVSQPGRNVTLSCLKGLAENATQLQWRLDGQNLNLWPVGQVTRKIDLFLPVVYFNQSGSYSCYAGGKLLRTWNLVVEEPPEKPNFTCYRKSLEKDILCEWKTTRSVSAHTKAQLWMRKGYMGENHTEQQCRYYKKSQKFTCRIVGMNHEHDPNLWVTMCVANLAGTASKHKYLLTDSLLKPDPPADLTVHPMEESSHKLRVTWHYPYSWGSTFYRLQFQLRYRPNTSEIFSEVHLQHGVTSYIISDALEGVSHIVQVRGREEFDHGTWSEWSRESIRMPWTEPKELEPEMTSYYPQFPYNYYFVNTEKPKTPGIYKHKDKPKEDPTIISLHYLLIIAVGVTLGLVLIVLLIVWYRKRWRLSGEGKPHTVPTYALTPLSPGSPLSTSPLLSPPASPISESSVDSPRVLDHGLYDVTNADYFLLPK